MNKKCFLASILMLCVGAFIFADNTKVIERNLGDKSSWQETFDINNKKEGKYNIVVTATDKSGNEAVAGPFNIKIDKDSDLPVAGITNPVQNMRVTGNLNIVGTCTDDDGVEVVNLIFDGNKEDIKVAEGKEFWSYYLKTNDLKEGPHTIEVYGTDINGLKGKSVKLTWQLDRRAPITEVTNIGMGTLVSGKINFEGTVRDGNGIRELGYSLEGNTYFNDLKLKEEKLKTTDEFGVSSLYHFSVPVDTTKRDDGPSVCWFRAVDNAGTESLYSFLYFVDNTKPEVKIVYPSTNDPVSGKVTIAGYAKDTVGIKSLKWQFGSESGDFELVAGNPYFVKELDAVGKSGQENFTVIAEDTAGNIVTLVKKLTFDPSKGAPKVEILTPTAGSTVEGEDGSVFVRGVASDNNGIASVTAQLDSNPEVTIDCSGVFYIPISGALGAGPHTISVSATNVYGVKSPKTSVSFTSKGSAPVFTTPLVGGVEYKNGDEINPEAGSTFSITANSSLGLSAVSYDLSWGKDGLISNQLTLKGGEKSVPVNIPISSAPWGVSKLTVSATDTAGSTSISTILLNVKNLSRIYGTPGVYIPNIETDGLTLTLDPEYTSSAYFVGGTIRRVELVPATTAASVSAKGNSIIIKSGTGTSEGTKIRVTTSRGSVYESKAINIVNRFADLVVPIKGHFVSADGEDYLDGMNVTVNRGETNHKLTAFVNSEASIKSVTYTITGEATAGGDVTQTKSVDIKQVRILGEGEYEFDIPLVNLPSRVTNVSATVTNIDGASVTIKGGFGIVRAANDSTRVDDKEDIYWTTANGVTYDSSRNRYILDGQAALVGFANVFGPVTATATGGMNVSVEGKVIKLSASKDGTYNGVSVRVTDAFGGTYTSSPLNILVGSSTPRIEVTSPARMAWVRNKISVSGSASSGNGIASLEYSLDNQENWIKTTIRSNEFTIPLDVTKEADGVITLDIRATDTTGKQSIYSTIFEKDTIAPEYEIIVPEAGVIINGENTLAMLVKDAGGIESVVYRSSDGSKTANLELSSMPNALIGTADMPISNSMTFRISDRAGNITTVNKYDFKVDAASDLPHAEIHLPEDNAVITRDFVISGVVYDDDGPSKIWYRIDNGAYTALPEYGTSFSLDVPLSAMTDNEHIISVYAEDIHGVKGPEATARIRVSLEEPRGSVDSPSLSETVKGNVTVKGTATDKNGIEKVQISIDNGVTYNDAVGTENWSYTFDSRVIQDATHVVFVKIWDKYGIQSLYSTLINVDNTSPNLMLELPLDDSKTTRNVFFSGQTTDNIGLKELYITIRSLDPGKSVPSRLARRDLVPGDIISEVIDISELSNGFYNIELTGTDAAGNISRVSRNLQLDKNQPLTTVDLLYPLNGEEVRGTFNIYGTASSLEEAITEIKLYVDGKLLEDYPTTTVTESGYFKFQLKPEHLEDGRHTYKAVATTESGKSISSAEQYIEYSSTGPWVTLDTFTYGDFAVNRPMLKGNAGYTVSKEDIDALKSKTTSKEQRAELERKTIKQVWLSFDNGKSFEAVSKRGKGKWKYRIENQDIADGYHFLLVKAEMANGENAITRTIVQVDRNAPSVKLISPGAGGRYNQEIKFSGLTSDGVALKNVKLTLRQGDKSAYEIPGFIQGLYVDGSFWGATLWSAGVGLTAFDNAVKVQVSYGQFTQEQRDMVSDFLDTIPLPIESWHQGHTNLRFGGQVIGAKIIAQLAYLPFGTLFHNHDLDWLSATLSLGANFSYFTKSGATDSEGNQVAQVLSAALAQIEFPRINFKNWAVFKTWSIYYEPAIWFIPSDVASDDASNIVPTFSVGLRMSLF